MKILVSITGALFTASILVMATAASADCTFGHSTKTAQSSSPIIAESPNPQTPKPDSGG